MDKDRRGFFVAMGSLAGAAIVGFGRPEAPFNERDRERLREAKGVDSFVHNAEMLYPNFDQIPNTHGVTGLEVDVYSLEGIPVIGHSKREVTRIPEDLDELEFILGSVDANGFKINLDLKSNDPKVAEKTSRVLPKGSFISTPHHNLLDELRGSPHTLLYTLNSEEKQREFEIRLENGERFRNSGVSARLDLLDKAKVERYKKGCGLYVLAYPADNYGIAAGLCDDGVNGITSNNIEILQLTAA